MTDYSHIFEQYGGHFKQSEWEPKHIGSLERIKPGFVRSVCAWRQMHGFPSMITSAWRANGAHSEAAIDAILFHPGKWRQSSLHPNLLFQIAELGNFAGIGIYFDWYYLNNRGTRIKTAGLHVDQFDHPNRPQRWFRDIHGDYFYMSRRDGYYYHRDGRRMSLEMAINKF